MAEPKPLASLTSGLLARKGGARPAMRRQQVLGSAPLSHEAHGHDDLGWNDMGYDVNPVQTLGGAVERHESGLSPMIAHDALPEPQLHRLHGDAADPVSFDHAPEPEVVHQQRRVEALVNPTFNPPVNPPVNSPSVMHSADTASAPAEPVMRADAHMLAENASPAVPPVQVVAPAATKARRRGVTRTAAGSKGSFAFTLRLDATRHLHLRLASATSNQSAQSILTTLLDGYFADQPMIAALAAQVPAHGSVPRTGDVASPNDTRNDSTSGERT